MIFSTINNFYLAITEPKNCENGGPNCLTTLPETAANSASIEKIFGIVFGTIAALAVLIIMLSALNWAIRGGDPEVITRSRKAIIYAAVGLALALLSEMLVLTLLKRI